MTQAEYKLLRQCTIDFCWTVLSASTNSKHFQMPQSPHNW